MLSITAHTEQTQHDTELTALRAELERLKTENLRLRTEDVEADDLRVRHIWIKAAREAQNADYCREYDRIAEAVGGIDRDTLRSDGELDESYLVTTHITIEVSLPIQACDADDAVDKIDHLSTYELRELATENGYGIGDVEVDSWDAREAERDD